MGGKGSSCFYEVSSWKWGRPCAEPAVSCVACWEQDPVTPQDFFSESCPTAPRVPAKHGCGCVVATKTSLSSMKSLLWLKGNKNGVL